MRRHLPFLALLALVMGLYFYGLRNRESGIPSHVSPLKKVITTPIQPARKQPAIKAQKSSLSLPQPPMAPTDLSEKLFSNESVKIFLSDWIVCEKKRVRFLTPSRGRGEQVMAVIPPLSATEKTEFEQSVRSLLSANFPGLRERDTELMEAELTKWIAPHDLERVIEISYFLSTDQKYEALSGRWFDVEDSSKFKDEYYYMDFGKIISDGRISKERLMARYGHLFSLQEEPVIH